MLDASRRYIARMDTQKSLDAHLLLAILKVAREECDRTDWNDLEPILAAAWEDLREEGTPAWDVVADEVERACSREGLLQAR